MSALGQKQTCALPQPMSALPPIATVKADSRKRSCLLYPHSGRVQRTSPCLLRAKSRHRRPGCDGILSLLQGKPSSKCDENCTGGCLNCASDMRSIEPLSEATEKQNHC